MPPSWKWRSTSSLPICLDGRCLGAPLRKRRDQPKELDPTNPPAFEYVERRHRGTAGGQHRIENQRQRDAWLRRQLVVVRHWLERLVVAVQAEVPNLGYGNDVVDRLRHAKAGAKNRHEADLFGDLLPRTFAERRLYDERLQFEVRDR